MRIIVCVKEVPDTTEVRINPETNTLIRDGVPSIINPFDLYALEEALKIKDKNGATVSVLTMGPRSVEKNLRDLIAMGADEAFVLSDRAFAGSDTWATSLTLSEGIKYLGGADIILTGKQAIDGDTAQVGPGIAEFLRLPQAIFVKRISEVADTSLSVERITENGYESLLLPLPAVISVVKGDGDPRLPSLRGMMKAKKAEIHFIDHTTLSLDPGMIGLSGSPTRVVKIFSPPHKSGCEKWEGEPSDLSAKLASELKRLGVLA
jgi:electron transfer flavoprotein beta subunit